jgi:hypothetical protein
VIQLPRRGVNQSRPSLPSSLGGNPARFNTGACAATLDSVTNQANLASNSFWQSFGATITMSACVVSSGEGVGRTAAGDTAPVVMKATAGFAPSHTTLDTFKPSMTVTALAARFSYG